MLFNSEDEPEDILGPYEPPLLVMDLVADPRATVARQEFIFVSSLGSKPTPSSVAVESTSHRH